MPAKHNRAQTPLMAASRRVNPSLFRVAEVVHRSWCAPHWVDKYFVARRLVLAAYAVVTFKPQLFAITQVRKNRHRQPVCAKGVTAKHAFGHTSACACQQVAAAVGKVCAGGHDLDIKSKRHPSATQRFVNLHPGWKGKTFTPKAKLAELDYERVPIKQCFEAVAKTE